MTALIRIWLAQEIRKEIGNLLSVLDDNATKNPTTEQSQVMSFPPEYWESPQHIVSPEIRIRGSKTVQLCRILDYGSRPGDEVKKPAIVRLCDGEHFIDAHLDLKYMEKFETRHGKRFTECKLGTVFNVRLYRLKILGACQASMDDGLTFEEQKYAAGGMRSEEADMWLPRKRLDNDATVLYRMPSFSRDLQTWLPPDFRRDIKNDKYPKHIRLHIHEMDMPSPGNGNAVGQPTYIDTDTKIKEMLEHFPVIAYNDGFPSRAQWEQLWFDLTAKSFLEMGWCRIEEVLPDLRQYDIDIVRETFEYLYPATGFAEHLKNKGFLQDFQDVVSSELFPKCNIYQILNVFALLQLLVPRTAVNEMKEQKRTATSMAENGPPRKVMKTSHAETALATQMDLMTQFNSMDWDSPAAETQEDAFDREMTTLTAAIKSIPQDYESFPMSKFKGLLTNLFELARKNGTVGAFASAIKSHSFFAGIFWMFVRAPLPKSFKSNKSAPQIKKSGGQNLGRQPPSQPKFAPKHISPDPGPSLARKVIPPKPVVPQKSQSPLPRQLPPPTKPPVHQNQPEDTDSSSEDKAESDEGEAETSMGPPLQNLSEAKRLQELRHSLKGLQVKASMLLKEMDCGQPGPLPLLVIPKDQIRELNKPRSFYPGIDAALGKKIRKLEKERSALSEGSTPAEGEEEDAHQERERKKKPHKNSGSLPTQNVFTIDGPSPMAQEEANGPGEESEEEEYEWSQSQPYESRDVPTADNGEREDIPATNDAVEPSRAFINNSPPDSSIPQATAPSSSPPPASPPKRKSLPPKAPEKAAPIVAFSYKEQDDDDDDEEEEEGGEDVEEGQDMLVDADGTAHIPAYMPGSSPVREQAEPGKELDTTEVVATAQQAFEEHEGISLDDGHPSIPETQLSPKKYDAPVNDEITSSPRTITGSPPLPEENQAGSMEPTSQATGDDNDQFSTPPERIVGQFTTESTTESSPLIIPPISLVSNKTTEYHKISYSLQRQPPSLPRSTADGLETFPQHFETVPETTPRKASSDMGPSTGSESHSERASQHRKGRHSLDGDQHDRDRSLGPMPRFEQEEQKRKGKGECSNDEHMWQLMGVKKPKNPKEFRAVMKMTEEPVHRNVEDLLAEEREKALGYK